MRQERSSLSRSSSGRGSSTARARLRQDRDRRRYPRRLEPLGRADLLPDDGRIELDTNVVERRIRPIVLNRKNALFAGHDQGAENWACLASLIETCKLHGVDPQTYFTDVLTKLVNLWPASRLDELMPWAWAAERSTNKLAAGRTESREALTKNQATKAVGAVDRVKQHGDHFDWLNYLLIQNNTIQMKDALHVWKDVELPANIMKKIKQLQAKYEHLKPEETAKGTASHAHTVRNQAIKDVNNLVNKTLKFRPITIWTKDSPYRTPKQIFASGYGDGKEFAIVKMAMMKQFGVPPQDMVFVFGINFGVMNDDRNDQAHDPVPQLRVGDEKPNVMLGVKQVEAHFTKSFTGSLWTFMNSKGLKDQGDLMAKPDSDRTPDEQGETLFEPLVVVTNKGVYNMISYTTPGFKDLKNVANWRWWLSPDKNTKQNYPEPVTPYTLKNTSPTIPAPPPSTKVGPRKGMGVPGRQESPAQKAAPRANETPQQTLDRQNWERQKQHEEETQQQTS